LSLRMVWYALAPPVVGSVILFLGLGAYLWLMPQHFTNVTLVGGGIFVACLLYPFMVIVTGWRVRAVNGSWHALLLSVDRLRRFFAR